MTKINSKSLPKFSEIASRLNNVPFKVFMGLVQRKHDAVDRYDQGVVNRTDLERVFGDTLVTVLNILEQPNNHPNISIKDIGSPFLK